MYSTGSVGMWYSPLAAFIAFGFVVLFVGAIVVEYTITIQFAIWNVIYIFRDFLFLNFNQRERFQRIGIHVGIMVATKNEKMKTIMAPN
jgi:hypothetical protein